MKMEDFENHVEKSNETTSSLSSTSNEQRPAYEFISTEVATDLSGLARFWKEVVYGALK